MGFDRKIKQLTSIRKNLDKFIGNTVKENAHILEDGITEQLHEKGQDGLGRSLGSYSDSTKQFKNTLAGALGRDTRSDHITLKDTGDFYESIKIKLTSKGVETTSQPQKDTTNLLDKFGKEILFVSEANIDAFRQDILVDDLRKQIRAAL